MTCGIDTILCLDSIRLLKREPWSRTVRAPVQLQDEDVVRIDTDSVADVSSQEAPSAAIGTQAGVGAPQSRKETSRIGIRVSVSGGHPHNYSLLSA